MNKLQYKVKRQQLCDIQRVPGFVVLIMWPTGKTLQKSQKEIKMMHLMSNHLAEITQQAQLHIAAQETKYFDLWCIIMLKKGIRT